jgi:hypothetical protein
MTTEQIKDYLQKYRITSPNQLSTHIEQLENNTRPNKTLIFELYNYLEDWSLSSFFDIIAEKEPPSCLKDYWGVENIKTDIESLFKEQKTAEKNKKEEVKKRLDYFNPETSNCSHTMCGQIECKHCYPNGVKKEENTIGHSTRLKANTPMDNYKFFANEEYAQETAKKIVEEREKLREQKSIPQHLKEYPLTPNETFYGIGKKEIKKNKLYCIPTDATNIEVFHLETKDDGDKTAFIGFNISNGNFSFVEVPFTSPKTAEKEIETEESKGHNNRLKANTPMKDDVITNSNRGEKEILDYLQGIKENNGKTDYSEIDFDIIDLMAERFNKNKHKYPKGNMLKPIDEKELLMAMFRHWRKMFQPIDNDEETFEEHLAAILCNAQMIYQQRKLKKC